MSGAAVVVVSELPTVVVGSASGVVAVVDGSDGVDSTTGSVVGVSTVVGDAVGGGAVTSGLASPELEQATRSTATSTATVSRVAFTR